MSHKPKKTLAVALLLSLLLSFSGCAMTRLEGTTAEPEPTEAPQTEAPQTEAPQGEPDELSQEAEETGGLEDAVALVSIGGEITEYSSMGEAWAAVNNAVDQDAEMVFLADWVAENGSFGSGDGYGETGNLTPKDRSSRSVRLTLNLNGHTLNRNLSAPIRSGNIISLKKDGVFTLRNGTLTGGNSSDRGAAVWIDNDETTVSLEGLTITGNHASGNGGAIFVKECRARVSLTSCTITGNSSDNYGGGMYVSVGGSWPVTYHATLDFAGKMLIRDNSGKQQRNNVCFQGSDFCNADIHECIDLSAGSVIYVCFSDFEDRNIFTRSATEYVLYQDASRCFCADNPKQRVGYFVEHTGHGDEEIYLTSV